MLAAIGGYHQRMRRHAPRSWRDLAVRTPPGRWRSAAGIRVSWRRRSATILPQNRRDRAELRVSSSKPLLRSVTVALDLRSAIFLELAGLGREARAFRLRDDNLPETGGRLALPGQGLRLPGAFIGVKNGALRPALVSPVIERARNEGLCSAAVQSTALQMRIRRKRVL